MTLPSLSPRRPVSRDLHCFSHPREWPTWPFLPVVRHRPGEEPDFGVLCDLRSVSGRCGFSSTVFLVNFFRLPRTEEALLALPREVFDSPEEMSAAGWTLE
jgi:hypothetical protein